MSDDDCAVISDGEFEKVRDNDVVMLDDSSASTTAAEAVAVSEAESKTTRGEGKSADVVTIDDSTKISPIKSGDCDVITLDDDVAVPSTSSETATMDTPKKNTVIDCDDEDDDVVMVTTPVKEAVGETTKKENGDAIASYEAATHPAGRGEIRMDDSASKDIESSSIVGSNLTESASTDDDVGDDSAAARHVLESVLKLVEAGGTSASDDPNITAGEASVASNPPRLQSLKTDEDDDEWLGNSREADAEPGELRIDDGQMDEGVFVDEPLSEAVKGVNPDHSLPTVGADVKVDEKPSVKPKEERKMEDVKVTRVEDVKVAKVEDVKVANVEDVKVENLEDVKIVNGYAKGPDVRPKEVAAAATFHDVKATADDKSEDQTPNQQQHQTPTSESPTNGEASKESSNEPNVGGLRMPSGAAPPLVASSTLSDEDMNEIFNLFMDDTIPRDAVFQIPLNFDEIVEESIERLSQEAEKKVAGIVKRIINMEEEQAVIRQTMERRQTRIDRLVKTLNVPVESKAVGDVIVLDDADSEASAPKGPSSDQSGAKAKDARSEEDLVILGSKPGTTVYGYRPGQSLPQKKIPELRVGSKVFAKKSNDIWYRGVIAEILQESAAPRTREFKYGRREYSK